MSNSIQTTLINQRRTTPTIASALYRLMQRAAINAPPVGYMPPIMHEVLHSPGQPLDLATRAFMEPRFGHDFSRVRVHTGAQAAESARAINALAYTVGDDVVFGDGQYVPQTEQSRQLVAHELVHVLQQRPRTQQIDKTQVSCKEESKPQDEAEALIKKHKSFWGLAEKALGEDLLKRLPSQSDLILKVLDKLPSWNKDDVSLAVLEAATDEQIKSIATDEGGRTALLRMVRELESGPTFPDEQKQIKRVMNLVTEVAPVKVEEPGKEPRREVEVITFRTGSLDWLGKLIGAKGHTAIIVGGYAYSFEWDWRCGQTKEEYMKDNKKRDGVGQVLDMPDKYAIKLQKKLNEACSTGAYFIGGDICTDATARMLETVISGLKAGWDPQAFEKQLDAKGIVREKRPYPKEAQADVPPVAQTVKSATEEAQANVPPVAEPVKSATEEDENVKELKDKVSKLVNKKFGGDYKKAFDYYDANKDAGVDAAELKKLLEDAGVGNSLTRGAWVKGIMKRLDINKDGKIQWSEFESGTK